MTRIFKIIGLSLAALTMILLAFAILATALAGFGWYVAVGGFVICILALVVIGIASLVSWATEYVDKKDCKR